MSDSTKEDLTVYTSEELTLRVMNDELLYRERHRSGFIEMINEFFVYTPDQLHDLEQTLADDLEEIED